MEHVERVLATLRHKEPDRISIDFGELLRVYIIVALRKLLGLYRRGQYKHYSNNFAQPGNS